ncbi:MAG: site-specific integrase [Halothiobacillaceae bacterium]|nr:MAG: site-specific integrase [Halothiobacillaceae bacterium]
MANIRVRKETGKLYFDFFFKSVRCREHTALPDTRANRKLMDQALRKIEAEITLGTFDYAKTFPNSKRAAQFSGAAQPSVAVARANAGDGAGRGPTVGAFAEEWVSEKEVEWKRSYRQKIRDILDKYIRPEFGERGVSDIAKADLLKYRAKLAKVTHGTHTLSASRINQIMNVIKQILDEAADRFEFSTPFQGIKPLRLGRTQVDPFSFEEVQAFLTAVPEEWRHYFVVRFFTGMRTSEIDGLKWQYVNFDRREILIEETLVKGEEDTPKTHGSLRSIQMSQLVYDSLKAQQAVTGRYGRYVFCTRNGYAIQYNNVSNRVWYPTLKTLGLKRRNPYQTRHTAATLWLASGESPEWIARQMGHTNTKMLFTVYSRYVPNLTRQDGSAFERLLLQNFQLPPVFPISRDAESETGSSIHDRAEEKLKAVRHG